MALGGRPAPGPGGGAARWEPLGRPALPPAARPRHRAPPARPLRGGVRGKRCEEDEAEVCGEADPSLVVSSAATPPSHTQRVLPPKNP